MSGCGLAGQRRLVHALCAFLFVEVRGERIVRVYVQVPSCPLKGEVDYDIVCLGAKFVNNLVSDSLARRSCKNLRVCGRSILQIEVYLETANQPRTGVKKVSVVQTHCRSSGAVKIRLAIVGLQPTLQPLSGKLDSSLPSGRITASAVGMATAAPITPTSQTVFGDGSQSLPSKSISGPSSPSLQPPYSPSTKGTASLRAPPTGSLSPSLSPFSFEDSPEAKERNPWKHIGYRVFSRLVASDQTFFVLRRFSTLHARVALALQDGIVQLEEELNVHDDYNRTAEMPESFNNASLRTDPDDRRREIVEDLLPDKLTRYNNFINGYAKLIERRSVRGEDVGAIRAWFHNNPGAIDPDEAAYIKEAPYSELIAVQPKHRSWFRNVLEMAFACRLKIFQRIPCQCDLKPAKNDPYEMPGHCPGCDYNIIEEYNRGKPNVVWQHDKRLEKFSTMVVALVGLGMLIGPIWWLDHVSDQEKRLGIITGFIALFFVLLKIATKSHLFESLAAAAAYSAVLMVFIQMGGGI